MNTIKVTQTNKWFVVERGDSRIHMLNMKSLYYFLTKTVKLDKETVHDIQHRLEFEHSVIIKVA